MLKKFEICCGIEEPLEFHSEENYYYRLLYKKSVYSEIHKAHLKIMLFPADEQPLIYV